MNYNEFAKEIHVNSCAHGWWETERSLGEIIALCHSEASEALEEYRANRPMVYADDYGRRSRETEIALIAAGGLKPEGIAVELADVIIRIFDWFGKMNMNADDLLDEAKGGERWLDDMPIYAKGGFGDLIAHLHLDLSLAYKCHCNAAGYWATGLRMAVCCNEIFDWAKREGVDMDEILRLKHEYNKTRPYKHGDKAI